MWAMKWIPKMLVVTLAPWVVACLSLISVWLVVQASSAASAAGHRVNPLAICVGGGAALLAAAILTVPFWMVFKKAGAYPVLSILMLVPLLNIAVIYWVALFSEPKLGGNPNLSCAHTPVV